MEDPECEIVSIYDASKPGRANNEPLFVPTAEVFLPRDRTPSRLDRAIAWLAGDDTEAQQRRRMARVYYWMNTHPRIVQGVFVGIILVLLGIVLAVVGPTFLHPDTEPLVLPSGILIRNALKSEFLGIQPAGSRALSDLHRTKLHEKWISAQHFERGYYESAWNGRAVNVSLVALEQAMLHAPAHLCVTATAFGLDGLIVRPPNMQTVLFEPENTSGRSVAMISHGWPRDEAIDGYLAETNTIVVPREQWVQYRTNCGESTKTRLVLTEVACVEYARQLIQQFGIKQIP